MFQFTQPKRAATLGGGQLAVQVRVSIHAAQAGCDSSCDAVTARDARFNSRSPSGLRPIMALPPRSRTCFNSRSPSGLRPRIDCWSEETGVSIHAAQAGCDYKITTLPFKKLLFQFTQPKRAATVRGRVVTVGLYQFQFTQPKRAATEPSAAAPRLSGVSIHAAQAGCDGCCKDTTKKRFSQRINRESPY